ncbi:galanin receptor 2a-like [Biomphalaria glabrata]|uniref:Galanin receptor 2a-like n=1 Tax=Biomphalaria glabrata TaxID=6526 RepID=A0A2C9KH21_BIOGL|nr:galanin receptor 2a-like [Biomphalaria glabrata]KAI8781543.1 growth hormone secretagogue receptor type 1 [Biomphalaria glabrata]
MAEINKSKGLDDQYQEFFHWEIFSLVNNAIVCTLIGLLGLVANVINMMVFVRQGFNSSMNISFFSMAVSDIVRILSVEWANICFNPYIEKLEASIMFDYVFYITGGWTVGCACRITLHITLYVTVERCLCIVFPLTIRKFITITRTKIVIILIYFTNALTLVPEYMSVYLTWLYDVKRNATILGVGFRNNGLQTKGITFMLHVLLIVIGLFCIVVMTTVLVLQLRRQRKWRLKNSSNSLAKNSLTLRDRRSAVLVIVVATSVAICYIPIASLSLATVFVPDFYVGGKYVNFFRDSWALAFLSGIINSSSTILIYYRMSSKYQETFLKLLGRNVQNTKSDK